MFHKKAVLKNFAIFTGKHLYRNLFFNKNASLQGHSFIKKRLENFLRTPILKKICERLLLRVSLELFSIWTNNIGSEEDAFSKIKQNKNRSKTQLSKKNLPFHDVLYQFVFLFFSTLRQTAFTLHDKKTVLKQLNQWAINPGPMEKLSYLFTYTVHFVLITWISELGNAVLSSVL